MKTDKNIDDIDTKKIDRMLAEIAGRDPDTPPPPVTLDSLADQIADVDRRLMDVQRAVVELAEALQKLAGKL